MSLARKTWTILKETYEEFSGDECMAMGASLAFYTMFSLPPILILVITIAGSIWQGDVDTQQTLLDQMEIYMGAQGAAQIQAILQAQEKADGGLLATVLGVFSLVFGATGVVAQLQTALDKAWGVEPDPEQGGVRNFLVKRAFSFVMILVFAILLLTLLVLSTLLSAFSEEISRWANQAIPGPVLLGANYLISFVIVLLLFAAVFKILPDARIRWRDVWMGAAVTALMFIVGTFLITFYLGQANVGSPYGAAGSLALLLVWVYYSSLILLLGAEFTQVWARHRGARIRPARGAVRVVCERRHVREDRQRKSSSGS